MNEPMPNTLETHIGDVIEAMQEQLQGTYWLLCERVITNAEALESLKKTVTKWAKHLNNDVVPVYNGDEICNY